MAKITRYVQNLFGNLSGASGNYGKFGSLALGAAQYTKDPKEIQSLDPWNLGWVAATVGNKSPALQDRNALDFLAFYQLTYMLQQGVPEWNADTTYYTNGFCSSAGKIYKSLVDDNTEPVSNTNNWIEYVASVIAPYLPNVKSTAKAWVSFNGRGSVGLDCTIYDSYGVSNVVKTATGTYNIFFSTAFANRGYAWSGNAGCINEQVAQAGDGNIIAGALPGAFPNKSEGNLRVYSIVPNSGGLSDTTEITVTIFGQQ